jgi:uncharacterized membrane protein
MLKTGLGAIVFFALLASISGACADIEFTIGGNQSAVQGNVVSFPVVVKNTAIEDQLVKLSGICPEGLECAFTPSPAYALLSSEERKAFNLMVYTMQAGAGDYSIPVELSTGSSVEACDEKALGLTLLPRETPVVEPVNVSLTPSKNLSALPGEVVEFVIDVINNLDDKVYASFSSEGNPFEDSTTFEYSFVTLDAGEEQAIRVKTIVPAGSPGNIYDWVFTVTLFSGGTRRYYALPAHLVVVAPTLNLQIWNEPIECLNVSHGQKKVIELEIFNRGETNGPFELGFDGTEEVKEMVSVEPREFELKPGEKKFVNVIIAPSARVPLDLYHVYFTGKYLQYLVFKHHYCFEVFGLRGLRVVVPEEIAVPRGTTAAVPIKVKNIGTLAASYAAEYAPVQNNLSIALVPNKFSLAPGEEKELSLVLGATVLSPLGVKPIRIVFASTNLSQAVTLNVSVVPSNESEEGFLRVQSSDFVAVEGTESEQKVFVTNTKNTVLWEVKLSVDGVPRDWVKVDAAKDILPGKTLVYSVRVNAPAGSEGTYNLMLVAADGMERSQIPVKMVVQKKNARLAFQVKEVKPVEKNGAVREAILFMDVRNEGNTKITRITPQLTPEYVASSDLYFLSLAPGETRTVELSVKPAASTGEQEAPISLRAAEAYSATEFVKLPAMSSAGGAWFSWKNLAVLLIVVLVILVVLRWLARR